MVTGLGGVFNIEGNDAVTGLWECGDWVGGMVNVERGDGLGQR